MSKSPLLYTPVAPGQAHFIWIFPAFRLRPAASDTGLTHTAALGHTPTPVQDMKHLRSLQTAFVLLVLAVVSPTASRAVGGSAPGPDRSLIPGSRPGYTGKGVVPVNLRTEYLNNPEGIDETKPRLSWQLQSGERSQKQTAYRILVASSTATLGSNRGDLWDSGKVKGSQSVNVVYGGSPLSSRQQCFWKVQVWEAHGRISQWSQGARWSMGLLKPEDWQAQWISFKDSTPVHASRETLLLPPARQYRKEFSAAKPVKRATLYTSALGIGDPQINGRRVSDTYFEPGWSDYLRRAYYRTHDVTALVKPGANAIGITVADGWYAGYVGYGLLVGYGPNKAGRAFYGKTPALLAQLEVEYADGAREVIGTDATWRVSDEGPTREGDLIMGEAFDARLDHPGWTKTGFKDETWAAAIRAEENGSVKALFSDGMGDREVELGFQKPAKLQAYSGPPIRVTEELKARRMTEPKPGVYVFDMGENFAGNIRLKVKGRAGTRVQIRYAEMLHPDGRLMTENLRKARASDSYTLRGDAAGEVWTPRFTYHGFQFVELTGLTSKPDLGAVTGLVLHSDTPLASSFSCSDEVSNQLFRNIRRTQLANYVEVPTDCPQRDERLGWMGDAQAYVRAASYNADVSAFFTKWMDDVEEAQRDFGAYPDYSPYPMAHGAPGKTFGTAWTDAGVICPWTIWQVYGDTRIIERHWGSLKRFMDWRKRSSPDLRGVSIGNTWGDWLNLSETTPIEFIDAAYFALDAKLMAEMSQAIGKKGEASTYRKLFTAIRTTFQRDYVKAGGALSVDTQTAYVLALSFGLLPDEMVKPAADRLAAKIRENGFRMATGFLGTKPLLPVLTAHGHHDLAVRLFQSRVFPSWGYEVVNGATSIWERWDSYTKEHGFNGQGGNQNAAMNSFSHYAFGAVCEWMFRDLAGIDAEDPGFQRIVLRPGPPTPGSNPDNPPIDWVKAEHMSAHGRIATAWKTTTDHFELDVSIPPNTTATLFLPVKPGASITEGGNDLKGDPGVTLLRTEGNRAVISLDSGNYRFISRQ